ncbi:MAG: OmpA family protein [Aeromicrobium sp.]|uniref:OmpA family protein n=1 Tax=Aeromicrobium sp. TaxID=1871063 RepID=UPI00260FE9DE|nr:OmpA family protein [Aeromicrobium sp.]MDF1705670.1 OmpA family protein [Aeromicrobium sp.]
MSRHPRRTVRRGVRHRVAVLAALAVVAGCTSSQDDASGADESLSPDDVVETVEVITQGGEVEARVHPLVAVDDYLVLTVDLEATSIAEGDDFGVPGNRFEGDATLTGSSFLPEEAAALRLVDSSAAQIHLPATDREGRPVGPETGTTGSYIPGSGFRVQRVYAAPPGDVEEIGLLLPSAYVDAVPVVAGDAPPPVMDGQETDSDDDAPADIASQVDAISEAPVLPLEGFTRQLEGSVEVIESTEQLEIRLAGDVLFATGSAELTPAATQAIDAAVATIESYEGGTIDIVGHTDDVGDDASNQVLSEQRAASVSAALEAQVPSGDYDLKAEGRGETEPLLPNSSDENRQLNRRVTLTLTSEKTEQTEVATSGEIPPFKDGPLKDGAVADASTGFERQVRDGLTYRVTAPAVRRVDGMLVVTVEAERLEDTPAQSNEPRISLSTGVWSYRGSDTGYSANNAGFAPRILIGSTAAYPLDYRLGDSAIEGDSEWRNASDTIANDFASGGDTVRFVALYRDIPGAETITLEQPFVIGTAPWRLTDVPVEG